MTDKKVTTKDNPECYHGALEYLSEITGISAKIEKDFKSLESLRGKNGKLMYSSYYIHVIKDGVTYQYPQKQAVKGGSWVYKCGEIQFPIDTKWDRIYAILDRPIADFGVQIESCGNYKDSLGGGWYCNVPLYRINDFYFAHMECSCCK